MIKNTTAVIDLQFDVNNVAAGATEIHSLLKDLEQSSSHVAKDVSQAFTPMVGCIQELHIEVNKLVASLGESIVELKELFVSAAVLSNDSGFLDGFFSFYNTIVQGIDKMHAIENSNEKLYSLFADIVTAPSISALAHSLFPNTSDLFDAVGEWTHALYRIGGDGITKVFSQLGDDMQKVDNPFAGVFDTLGTALGHPAVLKFALITAAIGLVIAAIVALVKLIIDNWDVIVATLENAAQWFDTTIIQPIAGFLTELWNSISTIVNQIWNTVVTVFIGAAQWVQDHVIQPILNFFTPVAAWFSTLFSSISQTVEDILYNIFVLIRGYLELVFTLWKTIGLWFYENVIQPVFQFFAELWSGICTFAANTWTTIQGIFSSVAGWFHSAVIQPVAAFFAGMWDSFTQAATGAWENVKSVFSAVAGFFGDIFSDAWQGVVDVFSTAGNVFTNLTDGILSVFKTIVNGLIDGINSVIAIPFNGINVALQLVKGIELLGITPFADLRIISIPEIPHLAKGAVLPANKPFLAMVGDQKHGTNVEAPLATIQEAVALVMDDQLAGMMAGFEAVVRAIQEKDNSVVIGDDIIWAANGRHAQKMAVVRGGYA